MNLSSTCQASPSDCNFNNPITVSHCERFYKKNCVFDLACKRGYDSQSVIPEFTVPRKRNYVFIC